MRRGWIAVFLCCWVALALGGRAAADDDSRGDVSATLRDLVSGGGDQALSKGADERDRLLEFYALRDYRPAWTGSDDAIRRAELVRTHLAHADAQGLNPADYAVGGPAGAASGLAAARAELALTAALLRYATDVHDGRVAPAKAYDDVRLPAPDFDAAKALQTALAHSRLEDFLDALPPQSPEYRALVAGLARYRAVAAKGGWKLVAASSPTVVLAARLSLEDPDLASTDDPGEADVANALMRYQARNGLKLDGTAGPETVRALNQPVASRVKAIEANLERERWLPRTLEERYVLVNAADESLDFIRGGEPLLHSRVVVGKASSPTPILRAEIKAVIANPAWDIPDMIADEILPHVKKDAGYLKAKNIVLVDGPADDPNGESVDWSAIRRGHVPYQLRQAPGTGNVLGAVVLDMPNDLDVYLHDTPNKKLFDANMREASHGCVRVEQILPLAATVLTGDPEDNESLTEAIASGQTERLELHRPVPVYLVYRTVLAQADGTAGFRPDRYGRDRRLAALLAAPRPLQVPLPALTASR
jgi:L,D-transpeptidase YcbB